MMVESAEPLTEPAADAAVPGFDLSRFKLISQGAEAVSNSLTTS